MSIISDIFDKLPKDDAQVWMEARSHAEDYAEHRYRVGVEEGRKEAIEACEKLRQDVYRPPLSRGYNEAGVELFAEACEMCMARITEAGVSPYSETTNKVNP